MAEGFAPGGMPANWHRHQSGPILLAPGVALGGRLGGGIWEVRSRLSNRIARTLFFVRNETIVLLHGFIKKTRVTPSHDLALAQQRKHIYEQIQ